MFSEQWNLCNTKVIVPKFELNVPPKDSKNEFLRQSLSMRLKFKEDLKYRLIPEPECFLSIAYSFSLL